MEQIGSQSVLELILKSQKFVQFEANLTQYWCQIKFDVHDAREGRDLIRMPQLGLVGLYI